MRILLTNDDGIHAPGLFALHRTLSPEFDVHIVAPETEMSAAGHAITLNSPLRVNQVHKNGSFYGHSVAGTPADCVKIAVKELLERSPDVIISGINLGRNVGVDILYSGTVSAATEGAFLGFKSMAVSLDTRQNPRFGFAARFTKEMIPFVTGSGLRDGTALNINIPALPPEEIEGVFFTRQGTARFEERFEKRIDPRGNVYYWLAAEIPLNNNDLETDWGALDKKRITITPIHYDLTCEEELERLKESSSPRWHELKRRAL